MLGWWGGINNQHAAASLQSSLPSITTPRPPLMLCLCRCFHTRSCSSASQRAKKKEKKKKKQKKLSILQCQRCLNRRGGIRVQLMVRRKKKGGRFLLRNRLQRSLYLPPVKSKHPGSRAGNIALHLIIGLAHYTW